jgi:hypothetical protein
MRREAFSAFLLSLALVASQATAAWHGIDHLLAPADHSCVQCLHPFGKKPGLPAQDRPVQVSTHAPSHYQFLSAATGTACVPVFEPRAPPFTPY